MRIQWSTGTIGLSSSLRAPTCKNSRGVLRNNKNRTTFLRESALSLTRETCYLSRKPCDLREKPSPLRAIYVKNHPVKDPDWWKVSGSGPDWCQSVPAVQLSEHQWKPNENRWFTTYPKRKCVKFSACMLWRHDREKIDEQKFSTIRSSYTSKVAENKTKFWRRTAAKSMENCSNCVRKLVCVQVVYTLVIKIEPQKFTFSRISWVSIDAENYEKKFDTTRVASG